jgi:hypothetical protein
VAVCLFHVFLPTFPCFFGDVIEEIYNKDASLSIHLKNLFTSVHGLCVACNASGVIQAFCSIVEIGKL